MTVFVDKYLQIFEKKPGPSKKRLQKLEVIEMFIQHSVSQIWTSLPYQVMSILDLYLLNKKPTWKSGQKLADNFS